MNYGLIIIFDEDTEYANCLADYFRIKGCLASEILVFTRQEPFLDFLEKNTVDILIIHQDFSSLTDGKTNINNIFILKESPVSSSLDKTKSLYKYTSAEELLRQVMAGYDPGKNKSCIAFHGHECGQIIGVYSPVGRIGKTSLALSLGLKLSLNNKCLFLTFDEASPLSPDLAYGSNTYVSNTYDSNAYSGYGKNLGDLLYYFLQSPDWLESKFVSAVKSIQSLDMVSPSDQPGIYSEITPNDWISFLTKIKSMGKYQYIILDFGALSPVYPLLKLCDHLFFPELSGDFYSDRKMSVFLDSIQKAHGDNSLSFDRVTVPQINFSPKASEYIMSATSGELGHFTNALITAHNL